MTVRCQNDTQERVELAICVFLRFNVASRWNWPACGRRKAFFGGFRESFGPLSAAKEAADDSRVLTSTHESQHVHVQLYGPHASCIQCLVLKVQEPCVQRRLQHRMWRCCCHHDACMHAAHAWRPDPRRPKHARSPPSRPKALRHPIFCVDADGQCGPRARDKLRESLYSYVTIYRRGASMHLELWSSETLPYRVPFCMEAPMHALEPSALVRRHIRCTKARYIVT